MDRSRSRKASVRITAQDVVKYSEVGEDPQGFLSKMVNRRIGHGVFTIKPFNKGDVLLEYRGMTKNEQQPEANDDYVLEIVSVGWFVYTKCQGKGVFRAVQSLRNVLAQCNATVDTRHIKATALRKYLATNCQLMNLNDTELDWVLRHLGHSKITHTGSYRLPSSTIERTKIAKLLVLLENGLISKAQGSSLTNSQLDDMILKTIEMDPSSADDISDQSYDGSNGNAEDGLNVDNDSGQDSGSDWHDDDNDDRSDTSVDDDARFQKVPKVQKSQRNYQAWSDDAINVLRREFKVEIDDNTYPTFEKIRNVIRKYPLYLQGRTPPQIKAILLHLRRK